MIVAIDGPAASGKGTIARSLAEHFGFEHLDSGLFYRLYPDVESQIKEKSDSEKAQRISEEFAKVDKDILRNEEHARRAAYSAQDKAVRRAVTLAIKNYANSIERSGKGLVIDGRDIATEIFPDADVKIFITASLSARAMRRWLEMRNKGQEVDLAKIEADLEARDERDRNRAEAPLRQAEGAALLDTSNLTKEMAVATAIALVEKQVANTIG